MWATRTEPSKVQICGYCTSVLWQQTEIQLCNAHVCLVQAACMKRIGCNNAVESDISSLNHVKVVIFWPNANIHYKLAHPNSRMRVQLLQDLGEGRNLMSTIRNILPHTRPYRRRETAHLTICSKILGWKHIIFATEVCLRGKYYAKLQSADHFLGVGTIHKTRTHSRVQLWCFKYQKCRVPLKLWAGWIDSMTGGVLTDQKMLTLSEVLEAQLTSYYQTWYHQQLWIK